MIKKNIPFNSPYCGKEEVENIKKLASLRHYSGNGFFSKKCDRLEDQQVCHYSRHWFPRCLHAVLDLRRDARLRQPLPRRTPATP